jgi:cobalt-zinc-cadmium efflux system protein
LVVTVVVIGETWGLLRDSLAMSMSAVPSAIDPGAVREFLAKRAGVLGVHDLHIWPMSTTEVAMTAHLVIPSGHPGDEALFEIASELREHFGIGHATLQVEIGAAVCPLAPDYVV